MINLDNVDRPAILAEVTAAFYQYEEALVSNNIEALDALFWHDPRTVRLGAGENLYGIEAIRAFRAARPAAGLARDLRHTTITTFVESTSGVEAGGRTGLTSIVVAVLFAVMVFFSPLILMIPDAATGPALIFVGFLMVSGIRNIDFSDFTEAFGPFVMIMFVIFCGSIAAGIAAGILAYIIIKTATGKFKELHPVMYVLAVPLVMYFVFK